MFPDVLQLEAVRAFNRHKHELYCMLLLTISVLTSKHYHPEDSLHTSVALAATGVYDTQVLSVADFCKPVYWCYKLFSLTFETHLVLPVHLYAVSVACL